jgi:two-component system sensor histidine kinase/response regulator
MSGGQMTGDVLVVDDSPHNTELLSTLLLSHGHTVRVANGGRDALRLAQEKAPDLVLLDVHMPDLDGFTVCQTLRETWASSQMPVVFLSAAQDAEHKVKAFASGAVDFVTKPFNFDEILARVATHLELKRRTVELEDANHRLRREEEARRHFITALVHDIKNPLTPMLKNTEWLMEQPISDPEVVEVFRDIHVASNHLYRMVLSLLDVARGPDRQMGPRVVRVPLKAWVEDSLALLRLQLRWQPNRLRVVVEGTEAVFDPNLISRVLQNIIENALKYAPREMPILVEVKTLPEGLVLVVEDRGAGVRAEDRERIFTSWTRLEEIDPHARSSHGIGLAFCKQAVEAHGGHIRVETASPNGARFVVTVPPSVG